MDFAADAAAGTTTSDKVFCAVPAALSFTVRSTVVVPAVVGVPERTGPLSVSPGGNGVAVQVYGAVPPTAKQIQTVRLSGLPVGQRCRRHLERCRSNDDSYLLTCRCARTVGGRHHHVGRSRRSRYARNIRTDESETRWQRCSNPRIRRRAIRRS